MGEDAKKYKLTKVADNGEFDYRDQDEVAYNSPAEWFWTGILGGCGCGNSDELAEMAVDVLYYFGTPHYNRSLSGYPTGNETREVLAHWMDSKDLIEHGTGIGGSWLTEKGRQIHDCLKLLGEAPRITNKE